MSGEPIISIHHLNKKFPMAGGNFYALSQINLSFQTAEFAGLVGPSGSGKTTLLNLIGTLDRASEGEIKILGKELGQLSTKEAAEMRMKVLGFIFQTHNLLPIYTVYENVELPLLLLKWQASDRHKAVMKTLDWVGLTDKVKSRPPQLSGGQCQRAAIARVMVKGPGIVLADEPTANLDAENSHSVLQTMKRLNQELKTTFLFSTHDEKVIRYLDRKITLEDGKIIEDEIQNK
ncbi:MAG: ABC transporter ATP-binding protein [SAR324 cluster bacterium]|nr:ABC transporter ATP-binding protein [SAR324 cluster bacterium]